MFQPPKREYQGRKTAGVWLFDYLRRMGPTLKSDVLYAGIKEGFGCEAIEKAYSRGRQKGNFAGEVEGFQGNATWSLTMLRD
jgi:hypothetical protein